MHLKQEAIEEILESLWGMREQNSKSVQELAGHIGPFFDHSIIEQMVADGLVTEKGDEIEMTEKGELAARKIIRAHRIGETLLHHVFGWDFEKAACEFEHTSSIEMVDGICVLLGHPQYCPHGKPIPPGECCTKALSSANSEVQSLLSLPINEEAKVAYINCADSKTMHKLNSLQIRPGSTIKMQQTYPCYVIECEGAIIALEEGVGENVKLWASSKTTAPNIPINTEEITQVKKGFWRKIKDAFTGN